MDEATAGLDNETEAEVTKAIGVLSGTKTMLIVAHRLSTVMNADQILVMDDGQIVERGTHEQLLAAHGAYFDLYQKQLLREELGME